MGTTTIRKARGIEPRVFASQVNVAQFFGISRWTLQRHREELGHVVDGEIMYDLNEVHEWLRRQQVKVWRRAS